MRTSSSSKARCQVPDCSANMEAEGFKSIRLRVCDEHAKAVTVYLSGGPSRFCQQCAKFHLLEEFNGANRGCRKRLEKHNERRKLKTRNKRIVRDVEDVMHKIIDVKQKGRTDGATVDPATRELAELEPADIVESLLGANVPTPAAAALSIRPATTGENLEAPCGSSAGGGDAGCDTATQKKNSAKRVRPLNPVSPWSTASTGSSQVEETLTSRHTFVDGCAMSSCRSNSSGSWYAPEMSADQIINMGLEGNYQHVGSSADVWGGGLLEQAHRFARNPSAAALDLETHCGMTLKIVGITPGSLPHDLHDEIISWLQVPPKAIHGSIRPGCVHLTVDMWFNSPGDAATAAGSAPLGFAKSVTSGETRFPWCIYFTQLRVGDHVVVAEGGRVIKSGIAEPADKPNLALVYSRVASVGGTVQLKTDCEGASRTCTLLCRVGGFYHDVVINSRTDLSDGTALLTAKLPSDIGLNTVWFELCDLTSRRLVVSASIPLLVVDACTLRDLNLAVASCVSLATLTMSLPKRQISDGRKNKLHKIFYETPSVYHELMMEY